MLKLNFKTTRIDTRAIKYSMYMDLPKMKKKMAEQLARDYIGYVGEYPPESEANAPSEIRPYYIRGVGLMAPGGKFIITPSEHLGDSWGYNVRNRGIASTEIEVYNTASYYIFVHGVYQAVFHRRRGWRTVAEEGVPWLKEHLPNYTRSLMTKFFGLLKRVGFK